jgi:hypothetical protein
MRAGLASASAVAYGARPRDERDAVGRMGVDLDLAST